MTAPATVVPAGWTGKLATVLIGDVEVGTGFPSECNALADELNASDDKRALVLACELESRCEHCGAPNADEHCLGAHGDARLCVACARAVFEGGPCPLGAACPEEHAA